MSTPPPEKPKPEPIPRPGCLILFLALILTAWICVICGGGFYWFIQGW